LSHFSGLCKEFFEEQLIISSMDDILFSMKNAGKTAQETQNLAFIYTGLGSISGNGREHLKNVAQSLLAMQNHPGFPIPDNICKEIISDPPYCSW